MRNLMDIQKVREFMKALGLGVKTPCKIYFSGGVSSMFFQFRDSTVDIDLQILPDSDEVYRLLPKLKEKLKINIEISAPDHFIPEIPDWESRSVFIERIGKIDFFHYDFYSQALSKLERHHAKDLDDVQNMIRKKLISISELKKYFHKIEPNLYRYPAIDPKAFQSAVDEL